MISLVERGHFESASLRAVRRIGAVLDLRLDVIPRWRGGELDRLLNARHSSLHESVAKAFLALPGWTVAPEVSFSRFGERGVMDVLAWCPERRALLVIELKTEIIDVQGLIGTVDRYRRLARGVALDRGWSAKSVSCWVIVSDTRTNRRRVEAHVTVLRSAFPSDGRRIGRWLRAPDGALAGLSFWSDASPGSVGQVGRGRHRVRRVVVTPD